MKLHRSTAASTLAFVLAAASASALATPIFSDDFNRAPSNTVGNGWHEVEGASPSAAADVSIVERGAGDNEMQVRDNDPNGIASQLAGISTLGYTSLTLAYDWAPTNNTEAGDLLFVEWRDGPAGSWTQIAAHALLGTGMHTSELWSLPDAAGVADFEFRYRVAVNANNEGATIDNVVLSGRRTADEASAVAEPGSLALAGLGLCLLPWVARGRRRADG
jgi:hypothetical protein